ncbi:MAG: hypothetical protein WBH24_01870 [Candidatus Acidiferrum sp.]
MASKPVGAQTLPRQQPCTEQVPQEMEHWYRAFFVTDLAAPV